MRGALMTDKDWALEKGALEQEVSRDISDPGYLAFAWRPNASFTPAPVTPKIRSARGPTFDKTTGEDPAQVLRRLVSPEQRDLRHRRRRRSGADAGAGARRLFGAIPVASDARASSRLTLQADLQARRRSRARTPTRPVRCSSSTACLASEVEGQRRRAIADGRTRQSAQQPLRAGRTGQGAQRQCAAFSPSAKLASARSRSAFPRAATPKQAAQATWTTLLPTAQERRPAGSRRGRQAAPSSRNSNSTRIAPSRWPAHGRRRWPGRGWIHPKRPRSRSAT